MQLSPDPMPAVTARNASGADWLSVAINAGYACVAAPSRPYSLSSLPLPGSFFEALRRGWTIAEAWLIAQPFTRDGIQLLGDPLTTVGFPAAGYDVFGPVERLDQIDLSTPRAILHAGQQALQLTDPDIPAPGETARYLVRRVDEHGRSDCAAACIWATIADGAVIHPAPPCWPAVTGWRLIERGNQITLSAVWPAALRSLGIERVEVHAQAESGSPTVLAEHEPGPGDRRVTVSIDRPTVATRYRFAAYQGSYQSVSPWSIQIDPTAPPTLTLTPLEVDG